MKMKLPKTLWEWIQLFIQSDRVEFDELMEATKGMLSFLGPKSLEEVIKSAKEELLNYEDE